MKRFTVFVLSVFSCLSLYSQDLIVKSDKDSIDCLIQRRTNNHIVYIKGSGWRSKTDSISVNNVISVNKGYFMFNNSVRKKHSYNRKTPIGSVSVGYGYMLGDTPSGVDDQQKKFINTLRQGINIDAEIYYPMYRYSGLGVKGSYYRSSASMYNISETINSYYIGPALCMSYKKSRRRYGLASTLSLGYTFHHDNLNLYDLKIKAKALTFYFDIGATYYLSRYITVHPKIGIIKSSTSKIEISALNSGYIDGRVNGIMSLSRVFVSLGFRIGKIRY